jgi:hypothetical protein
MREEGTRAAAAAGTVVESRYYAPVLNQSAAEKRAHDHLYYH